MKYIKEIGNGKSDSSKNIYVFDLDGTLADITHRVHHITKIPKDWDGFYSDCESDKPIDEIINLSHILSEIGEVWILTCRSNQVSDETVKWLSDNDIKYTRLFMRKSKVRTPDSIVKESWYNSLPDNVKERIQFVVEDRNSVVDMWRNNGVVCLQPRDGNF